MSRTYRNTKLNMVTSRNGNILTKTEKAQEAKEFYKDIENGGRYLRASLSRNKKIKMIDKKHMKVTTTDGVWPGGFSDADFGDDVSTPSAKKSAKQKKHRADRRKKIDFDE